ncbi:MAG: hypothetical protein E7635_05835 [Ruminococcaceae bacterium]|nr:hypothetical protein [Oscillospiraceae bacterium]
MKKALFVLFVLIFSITCVSCSGKESKQTDVTESETESTLYTVEIITNEPETEEITTVEEKVAEIVGSKAAGDVNVIQEIGGVDEALNEVVILADMSEEDKNAYAEEMAQEGVTVTYNDDGSTTITYDDGTTVIQTADGNFTMITEDGSVGQIGGSWPDNEYTILIPKPQAGTLLSAEISGTVFSAIYSGCTIDDAVTYSDLVKENGFDQNVMIDNSMYDSGVYSFSGSGKNGVVVTVGYLSEAFIVTVTK